MGFFGTCPRRFPGYGCKRLGVTTPIGAQKLAAEKAKSDLS